MYINTEDRGILRRVSLRKERSHDPTEGVTTSGLCKTAVPCIVEIAPAPWSCHQRVMPFQYNNTIHFGRLCKCKPEPGGIISGRTKKSLKFFRVRGKDTTGRHLF